jgi:hypothetical protein
VAEHEVGEQSPRAADGDKGPPTHGDDLLQEAGGDRCADAGMEHGDAARPVRDREDRVLAVRGREHADPLGVLPLRELLDQLGEEADHHRARHVPVWGEPAGRDQPRLSQVVLKQRNQRLVGRHA